MTSASGVGPIYGGEADYCVCVCGCVVLYILSPEILGHFGRSSHTLKSLFED